MNGTETATNFSPNLYTRLEREREEEGRRERIQQSREAEYLKKRAEEDALRSAEAKDNLKSIFSIQDEAQRILKEGQPFDFFIKTFQKDHESDLTAARCIALVFAASSVANGDGLHCYISGSSGKGKTHTAETMFRQLPIEYAYNMSFSDKYLFYAGNDQNTGLVPGVVVLVDDQTMSESVQEIFKVSVSHYREGTKYGTVVNQKAHTLKVPARVSWVLLKVDDVGDDQVMNRLIQARIEESEEKIKDSAKRIQEKYHDLKRKTISSERREVMICREMWTCIKGISVGVEVPCAGRVIFTENENLRNHELFFNLIMAHAVIHRWQRKETGQTEDGIPIILATKDDYDEACLIFEALYSLGGQRHNSLKNEDLVVDTIIELNPSDGIITIKQIAEKARLSHNTTYRAINGRNDGKVTEKLGGLLAKCPYIQKGGKRGQFELETRMEHSSNKQYNTEIVRKESFNEEIYKVDIEGLKTWKNNTSPVKLAPGFRWDRN